MIGCSQTQNCFEIFKVDGVIKAWKKDSDGKPVPGELCMRDH